VFRVPLRACRVPMNAQQFLSLIFGNLAKVEVEGLNPFDCSKNCDFFTSKILGIKKGIKY